MAVEEQAVEPEVEIEEPELEAEAEAPEADEQPEAEAELEGDAPEGEDEDEVEIVFGDEAAPASNGENSELVKRLRREIRERDQRLATLTKVQPQQIEVGEKPTLERCEYDEVKFEQELDAWKDRKARAEKAQAEAQKQAEAINARFAEQVANYQRQKKELGFRDYEAAAETALSALSEVQVAVIVKAAENSAKVVYALGRHPQKLAALAAIQDPVELSAAVARLDGTLKVTTKRKAPEPDRAVRGSAPLAAGEDKTLQRLEKEAERTGDRSKVIAHKRKLKAQGRL